VLLAFLAGFTIVFSVGLMFAIGGGRAHLAGRLTVAVAALFVLGALDTQAGRLAARRRPLLAPDPPGYRRYVVWSALGLLIAAALLLGLAWYLPAGGAPQVRPDQRMQPTSATGRSSHARHPPTAGGGR
jgi:hypothetical protein